MERSRDKVAGQRQLRVGEELRHALARVFARGGIRDPALAGVNLTVTEVRVSPDLKSATAFVVPFGSLDPGDAELARTVEALNRAAGFLRGVLAGEVELRHAPRLEFQADRTFDQADHVGEILNRPRVRRDLGPAAGSRADGGGHGEEA